MDVLTAPWLTAPATRQVIESLSQCGYKAWFVGGAVHNALLGFDVTDIDIATNAPPTAMLDCAKKAGLKAIPSGFSHGTVTFIAKGQAFEITTLRRDIKTDGRHAEVTFTDNIAEDAARRDFTINALYAAPTGEVLDPLGQAQADLARRHIRFIGTAEARINEDFLRILRFFRFHALYGRTEMDASALEACAQLAPFLRKISAERIGAEMLKLCAAPQPGATLAAMDTYRILPHIFPAPNTQTPHTTTTPRAKINPKSPQAAFDALSHCENRLQLAPNPCCRLALLILYYGYDAPQIEKKLRLSRRQTRHLALLAQLCPDTQSLAEIAYHFDAQTAWECYALRCALYNQPPDEANKTHINKGAQACFPVSGADLLPFYSGPALGAKYKALEAKWIASGFTLTRAELLAMVKATP